MVFNRKYLRHEKGFILATSLIMLSLLTLFSVAMYFVGRSSIQTSSSAQRSTEAYYYAETAIHYVAWALRNDAEFDSYKYTGSSLFPEPNYPNPQPTPGWGDYKELASYMWHPGPTGVPGAGAVDTLGTDYTTGQVLYFDNSPMGSRFVCMQSAAKFPNCIDVTLAPSARVEPVMYQISTSLPRYVKLEISSTGVITPSIPSLPHQNPPVAGTDIPNNGAVVWITAGDINNANRDIEIFPLDPANVYGGTAPSACSGGTLPNCPCNKDAAGYSTAQACDANSGAWVSSYSIVAYAIGYVDGKATHLIRAVIM
jgi:hypothetical protein